MLLSRLHVQSHRGITDLHLEDLARVSLLIGPNNSGKSSILEAIAILTRPLDPAQWVQVARQRDTDAELTDALWSIFRSRGVLRLDDGPQQSDPTRIEGHIGGSERALDVRAIATEDWDLDEGGAASVRISVEVDGRPPQDLMFPRVGRADWGDGVKAYRCYTVTPLTHRSGRTLVEHLSRVVDEGEKALALELLQLFDSDVESLDVSAGRRRQTVVVKHARRGTVDLSSFGDGMRRVVALALALSRAKNGILLVDELEAGIHPGVLDNVFGSLLGAAKMADVQIVATTHSLEAIDAIITGAAQSSESVVAYHLFGAHGDRGVRRYDYEELARLRRGGLDLR